MKITKVPQQAATIDEYDTGLPDWRCYRIGRGQWYSIHLPTGRVLYGRRVDKNDADVLAERAP
jgi:hypothetical protein